PIADPNRGLPEAVDFENFTCARDWYIYSQEPLPPPNKDLSIITPEYDRTKYRMPKGMAGSIFRGYPGRGQVYVAEHLQKEGWYDQEGWWIRGEGWFEDDKFPRTNENAVVGNGVSWSVRAWARAFEYYKSLGELTGMYL